MATNQERAKPNGEQEQQLREGGAEAMQSSDVVLDVPNVSVDEIHLNVEQLSARVSLDTAVAEKLVRIRAGVDVDLDKVELELKGVQAEAHLRVRLDNIARVVHDALATLRESSGLVEALIGDAERATGQLAQGPLSSATQTLAGSASETLENLDVTGRAEKIRETSKKAAKKVKRGFSRAVSAVPKLGRRGDAKGDRSEETSNGRAHARTDAETGRPPVD